MTPTKGCSSAMTMHIKTRALAADSAAADTDEDAEFLAPGTALLGGQYTIDRYLSSGGFGITYLARDSLQRQVVIKECYPEALCTRRNKTVKVRSSSHSGEFKTLVKMFIREARSIAKLDHPNIVGVHQIFEDNHTAYMALDLIEGPDLLACIDDDKAQLSPPQISGLLAKLLNAIDTIHAQDMLHRDISPDNILIDPNGEPVLIDFGAAREQASKKSRAISALLVVKDGYSPQEFYISGGKQGPASDLYSLAATFYHLICGVAPPVSQERLAAVAANQPDPYQPLAGQVPGYSSAFLQAIDTTMSVFPADRIQTAADWLALLDPSAADSPRPNVSEADTADIRRIVSRLVVEVGKGIHEDKQRAITEAIKPEPPEKTIEYLSRPDRPEGKSKGGLLRWLRPRNILRLPAAIILIATLIVAEAGPNGSNIAGAPTALTPDTTTFSLRDERILP